MHTLLRFLFSAIGLLVAAFFVSGVHGGPFLELVAVAVILGALNARPGSWVKKTYLTGMKGIKGMNRGYAVIPFIPFIPVK